MEQNPKNPLPDNADSVTSKIELTSSIEHSESQLQRADSTKFLNNPDAATQDSENQTIAPDSTRTYSSGPNDINEKESMTPDSDATVLGADLNATVGAAGAKRETSNLEGPAKIDAKALTDMLTEAKIEVTDYSHLQRHTEVLKSQIDQLNSPSENFEILGKVGEGGMGEILLAKDHDLRRTVAYKKLHAQFAKNEMVLDQFLNEVQITSQLEHPNVVPIYNLEVAKDGSIAYSMKIIQGKTFKDLIKEAKEQFKRQGKADNSHSLSVLLEHFLKVCNAMDYAHHKGVLHRDLKPANIMVGAYHEVCVMDWGIACLIGQNEHEGNQAIGTPRYMSPEQAGGLNQKLEARSDCFSLGLILFELVTLKSPIPPAKDVMGTLKNIIKGKRNPIVHCMPHVKIPAELKAIIDKATQRKRIDRYQSANELADDIRRYLRGDAVLAKPDTSLQKVLRLISKNREKSLALFLGVTLIGASMFTFNLYRHDKAIQQANAELQSANQAIQQAKEHEDQLHHALMLIAKQGNQIDQHFFYQEGILKSYGTAISQLLNYGQPTDGKYYTVKQWQNPAIRPPGTVIDSKVYGTSVNADWGVVLHAPGADPETMKTQSKIFHPLQHLMKSLVIDSLGKDRKPLSKTQANDMILNRKMPILWIFSALESGYYIGYPTTYNYKPTYDPRQRPWYKMGKKAGKLQWGEPYRTTGGEIDLPCTMPIYDNKGQFRGVAVIEMTFNYIQEHLLELKLPGVIESSLVNEKGEIVVSSIDRYDSKRTAKKKQTKTKLSVINNPKVRDAMQNKRSGYYIEEHSNGNILYAYYYISSQHWFYMIKAKEAEFLKKIKDY